MDETKTSLLRRVTDLNDQQSWQEFVRFYEPLLMAYVRKEGLNSEDAADVVQTIFISLLRTLPTFQKDGAKGRFRSWLWRIARNAVTDWQRARNKHYKIEARARDEFKESESAPSDEWDELHQKRLLEYAMQHVKQQTAETTWACFDLQLLQGKSGDEVAEQLGMKRATVYVNASRVLAKVRKQCEVFRLEFEET